MAKTSKSGTTNSIVPARQTKSRPATELLKILGGPALLKCESREEYEALYDRVRSELDPKGIIEEIWGRDYTDQCWEVLRLRRLKASFISSQAIEDLRDILTEWIDRQNAEIEDNEDEEHEPQNDEDGPEPDDAESLIHGWFHDDPSAKERVGAILAYACMDPEMVLAKALARNADKVEQLDGMITQLENRRNAALTEIFRHRDVVARLAALVDEAEDVEFEELPAPTDRKAA